MHKNIGNGLALYPTPLVVVGAEVAGKPTYTLAGHVGIIGHEYITVSLASNHYINQGIKAKGALTVSIVDEAMLERADYVGSVSGFEVDKSTVFESYPSATGAPVIEEAPVVMECKVMDTYITEGFETFICKLTEVYAKEEVLNDEGKLDYRKLKPVLFEMPTYEYLRAGEVIGKCRQMKKKAQ